MEFNIIIPAAAEEIIKENQKKVNKSCQFCSEKKCSPLTKFICAGFSAADIANYINKHPTFVEDVEYKHSLFDFDLFEEEIEPFDIHLFDED